MCVASLGVWHLGTNRRANERKCETCLPLPKLENGVPPPPPPGKWGVGDGGGAGDQGKM